MSEFVVPHTIRGEEATPQILADIDDNFRALCRALGSLSSGAGAGHDIISSTHLDSAGTPSTGALIIRSAAGLWTVLGIGSNGANLRVVAGLPEWVVSPLTPGVYGDAATIPVITVDAEGNISNITTVTAGVAAHNLLSGTHGDTTTASPLLGDLITGQQDITGVTDDSLYWADGEVSHGISTPNNPGTLLYWIDGETMLELIAATATGPVTWRRKSRGDEDDVWTMRSGEPGWYPPNASSGTGARVYKSANWSLAWGTETVVSFDTVAQDDAGFFSSGTPNRFTAPVAGWYHVTGAVTPSYAHIGLLWIMFFVNGVMNLSAQVNMGNTAAGWGGLYEPKFVSGNIYLEAGDYVELRVTASRTSGAASTIIGGSVFTHMSIVKA